MVDGIMLSVIQVASGVGGIAGLLAVLMWVRSGRDSDRLWRQSELESAAMRQDACDERAAYRELVSTVVGVVRENTRASEGLQAVIRDVCNRLQVHDERAVEVAGGVERLEAKTDEVLLAVERRTPRRPSG